MISVKRQIVSFSGGKDSTAMLLMMIEKKMQIDEIVFCDTGKEFPAMIDHIEKVKKYINRDITVLKSGKSFDYYLGEHVKTKGKWIDIVGYGWPGPLKRWCTRALKIDVINKYFKGKQVIHYIGIAEDEPDRLLDKEFTRYPLNEWGITEKQALQYCYQKGFDWGGLYEIFDRVSCWCCPLQPLRGLENLYNYFPELWAELIQMDKKSWRSFKEDYTVAQLTEKFQRNKRQLELFGD